MGLLVGRVDELALLDKLLTKVAHRGTAAVLLFGPAGSGKTTLLTEATRKSSVPNTWLGGFQMEQKVPFAAAGPILRRLREVPEGGEALDELLFGRHRRADVFRIFEAAYQALRELSPVVIVLDDVHWVDERTAALVHYFLRAALADGGALGLIAAGRPGPATDSLRQALERLPGLDYEELGVGPLDRDEARSLTQALDTQLSDEKADRLWERAGGSPFWLEMLASRGENRVERFLEDRLRIVGSDGVHMLELLALAGRPLTVQEIGELSRWPRRRTESAISALTHQGLVSEASGSVSVIHDLLREALLRQMPKRRASELHGRLASWLEELAGDDLQTAALALAHRRASGVAAGDLALRLVTHPNSRLLAVEVLAEMTEITQAQGLSGQALRWRVAELAGEQGEFGMALAQWTLLLDEAETVDQRARAALHAAEAAFSLDRHQECRGLLERARQMAPEEGDLVVDLDVLEARLLRFGEDRPVDAREFTRRALARIEREDIVSGRTISAALHSGYEQALVDEDYESRLDFADRMVDVAGSMESSLEAQHLVAITLAPLGRWQEAETRMRHVWAEVTRLAYPRLAIKVGPMFSDVLVSIGRLEEAAEVARESIGRAQRLGAPSARARRAMHLVDLARGDVESAMTGLEEELGGATAHDQIGYLQLIAWWWARIKGPGARSRVVQSVEEGWDAVNKVGCPRCRAEFELHAAEALARVERFDQAELTLAAWAGRTKHVPRGWALWRDRAQAAISQLSSAPELWEGVALEAGRQGLRLDAVWAYHDLAVALETSDKARAITELQRAHAMASDIGALLATRMIDQKLRALGVRAWRRSPSMQGAGVLTERESQIAHLLAVGATNPEIASTLFISRKTVERHVSNIMVKLGARNRAEVAGLMARGSDIEGVPQSH